MTRNQRIAKRQQAFRRGILAEYLAALYMMFRGYRILSMRAKTPVGEIDLVALKKNTLVFIEVKARKDISVALESVHARNRMRVGRAAEYFLMKLPEGRHYDCRFDIIAIGLPWRIQHLDNAWRPRA